jgi:hypothetical protein
LADEIRIPRALFNALIMDIEEMKGQAAHR